MTEFITIQTETGSELRAAIIRGKFAIHKDSYVCSKTNRPLYALTHIPTGFQVDGQYYSPLSLRASLRFLASRCWPDELEAIRQSPQCKLDAILAAELGEASSHWAMRRDFRKYKAKLQDEISKAASLNDLANGGMLS